ncbi:NACHT, LRR and PYD domains-containing protein 1 homolog [Engraulis encrasicolus]|uniref:NACHT, LRR and PYD domains-containing protein 1 homolog n=1 Tax=Engraulis encrasicolus TaxID=184585 RepID=UPI002FD3B576
MEPHRDMEETKDSPGAAGAEEPTHSGSPPKARDLVFEARRELINRIGEASLKAVLDGLQQGVSGRSAITSRQRNEVLQQHQVTQDQVTCLVDMLWKKGNSACQRFLSLLGEVNPDLCEDLFGPVDSAATTPKQEADQQPLLSKLKTSIVSKYKRVEEYNSLPGQDVLLTDRYTQLLIIEKHRQQEEREKEMRTSGAGFFGARQREYKSITVDQLFKPDGRGDVPQTVILQGNSGHGKSFTAQKIMLDWASGSLYQDRFELVLHLACKELDLYKDEEQSSVLDLVNVEKKFTPLIQKKLKESPEKVLLLIDGFDELQVPEIRKSSVKDSPPPAYVEAIVGALRGSILSECHLLVTTRPTALDKLNKLLKYLPCAVRCTEIMGFSEEGVRDYFKRFCKDEKFWEKALGSVKKNETLYTSCFIPVICWIVCNVFREHMVKHIEVTNALETTTSIFVHFVYILLKHHCQGLKQPVPDLLRSLGQLAESGIQKQQVLFDKKSVEGTVSDPTSVPFLCKFLLKETVGTKEMFSFMHLSFQEFFTALHYTQDEERVKELLNPIEQQQGRTHLLPVIQFLFGLANVKVVQDLKDLELTTNICLEKHLKEWVVKLIEKKDGRKMLFTLHCLYELHDEDFVREAMAVWDEVKFESIPLTRADCWVLLYCLQCCPTIPSLTLSRCNITPDKLRMLQPALNKCQELG